MTYHPRLLLTSILLICASNSTKKNFSAFYERAAVTQDLDIYLDVTYYSDIKGKMPGINKSENETVVLAAKDRISYILKRHGHHANFVHTGYGVFHEQPDDHSKKIYFSVGGVATQEEFNEPITLQGSSSLAERVTIDSINSIYPWAKYKSKLIKQPPSTPLTSDLLAPTIKQLDNNTLTVIKIKIGEVSTSKSVGSALLTGLLSAALTGGAYVHTSAPASGSQLEVMTIDTTTAEPLFYKTVQGTGKSVNATKARINALLKDFPKTKESVEIARAKEQKESRKGY